MSYCREWDLQNKQEYYTLLHEMEEKHKRQGMLVEYQNKKGVTQKAKLIYSEQTEVLQNYKKAYLRLLNDDFTDKIVDGKKVVGCKHVSELKTIGYID